VLPRRRALRVTVTTLVVVGAAACSGQSTASFATPSAMPATPSPWTPGSALPLNTRQFADSEAGAGQFMQSFFAAYNDAIATGDTRQVRTLIAPGCACLDVFDQVDATTRSGQHAVGERGTFGGLSIVYRPEGTLAYYFVSSSGGQLVDRNGSVVTPIPSEPPSHYVMYLRWSAGQGWSITQAEAA
jgi:hypothetical protein